MARHVMSLILLAFLAAAMSGFSHSLKMSAEPISKSPYHVSLQIDGKHACSGSILSPIWVITNAECVYDINTSSLTVIAAIQDIRKPESTAQIRKAKDRIIHEKYTPEGDSSDNIAVVKLATPLNLGSNLQARAIQLHTNTIKVGTPANVTGWGRSDVLRKARLQITQGCGGESTEFCAVTVEEGKGDCVFEDGAPLVIQDKNKKQILAGLYTGSPSRNCSEKKHKTIYLDVSKYLQWINSKISKQ